MNSFPFVRHHFLRSGFEVVDCPPLTAQLKNASEIRMLLDMRDILEQDVRNEILEFIFLTGNADFTPAIYYLRGRGRVATVLSNEYTASPYIAVAASHIDQKDLIALIDGATDAASDGAIDERLRDIFHRLSDMLPVPRGVAASRKLIRILVDAEKTMALDARELVEALVARAEAEKIIMQPLSIDALVNLVRNASGEHIAPSYELAKEACRKYILKLCRENKIEMSEKELQALKNWPGRDSKDMFDSSFGKQ